MALRRFTGEAVGDLHDPLGVSCASEGCESEAVRWPCNAEGDAERTHWHGGIHSLHTQGMPLQYCADHGLTILSENEAIRRERLRLRRTDADNHT